MSVCICLSLIAILDFRKLILPVAILVPYQHFPIPIMAIFQTHRHTHVQVSPSLWIDIETPSELNTVQTALVTSFLASTHYHRISPGAGQARPNPAALLPAASSTQRLELWPLHCNNERIGPDATLHLCPQKPDTLWQHVAADGVHQGTQSK